MYIYFPITDDPLRHEDVTEYIILASPHHSCIPSSFLRKQESSHQRLLYCTLQLRAGQARLQNPHKNGFCDFVQNEKVILKLDPNI